MIPIPNPYLTAAMLIMIVVFIFSSIQFWRLYYAARNMRNVDIVFFYYMSACLWRGFVFGAASVLLVPCFLYLLMCAD